MRDLLQNASAALIAYGPWGVFLLALVDSMGIPLPAAIDALLIGVAATSSHAPHIAYLTALLAVLGSVIGNLVLFLAARQGRRLMRKAEPLPDKRRTFEHWFRRYGLLTVFIPAITPLLPLPLKVFVISAGAFHTSLGRFLAVILTARVIRYFGEAYLGLQLGLDAKGFLIRNGWTLTGIALAMTFALFLLIRMSDRRRESLL
jgi:membrane protein YqaA with SNARE-associated domain